MNNQTSELNLRLSTIENKTVKTFSDEKIGTIKDIVLDAHRGEVAYVVLAIDSGFLNLGSKYFAIPWRAFSFNPELEEAFILDVSKEKLEKSPGFDKDNWPQGPQTEFISEVYRYYDLERYDRSYDSSDLSRTSADYDRANRPIGSTTPRGTENPLL